MSIGQAVQSIILNALGFTGRSMYLHPEFYEKKPIEFLVGEGLTPDDLNGDCLGSALDALYQYSLTELFYSLASKALQNYDIDHRFVHLDTTTFTLHRKNETDDPFSDTEVIEITKGFSKDNWPDL